ncbi:CTLH/CRA C-terminal to lish motif domain-containing protein [Dichotomopilus funicola]|uniref:CTLH/CRA C-terminal to lish motif domain-containing protein n=1 Tax=Dichotomopilus funicola TaxID=1934379 RepID=A0AAN6V546_9PEZI|nr:CTLH/CRA C-terminal to lish motif domain-containing protein [Dichotomopilus funicola]
MTNPYQQQQQQHNRSNFDSLASGRLPPLSTRRPSYASVVSGSPSAQARPARSGGFSHLLNPSPTAEPPAGPESTTQNPRFDTSMSYPYGGTSNEDGSYRDGQDGGASASAWPPRIGTGFPYFSRAFDLYMNKDPLLVDDLTGPGDYRFPSVAPNPNISETGFLAPSYLRDSVYLQKLEEKHKAKVLAERDGAVNSDGNNTSLKSAPSSSSLSSRPAANRNSGHLPTIGTKAAGSSHRGVAYDVVERPTPAPKEADDGLSPLPSGWNRDDKEASLDILGDGYEVRHTGRPMSDHEASSIRANHYMPPACGVYYYEITILGGRQDKVNNKTPPIAIGFASTEASLSRAPGWEPDSWGYHGDDGHSFASQNVGKPYAEIFGVGDTVGCLVNFRLNHALYTKNGRELAVAFKDIPFKDIRGNIYPIVGLKKKEDHILANFGQRPFMFDIDGYMARQRDAVADQIRKTDASKLVPGLSETELIQQLVLQFLQHDGYVETARAFAEELYSEKEALRLDPEETIQGISIRDDEDANNRQRIRRAVLEGDIDRAMKYTESHYPTVLRENERVYFRLRCRKFIEMIRKEAEHNMLLEEQRRRSHTNGNSAIDSDDEEMLEAEAANGDDDMDTAMAEEGDDVHGTNSPPALSKLSHEALVYGIELQAEFAGDTRRETTAALDEVASLLAYPNPLKVKEVAHLLDGSGRVAVAEELNSAILTSLGKSSRAALENVYAQTCVLLEDLRKDGGDGAFVTVDGIIRSIPSPKLR